MHHFQLRPLLSSQSVCSTCARAMRSAKSRAGSIEDVHPRDSSVPAPKTNHDALTEADGRSCKFCECKDTDPDPCFVGFLMLWGAAPVLVEGVWRNSGKACGYCCQGPALFRSRGSIFATSVASTFCVLILVCVLVLLCCLPRPQATASPSRSTCPSSLPKACLLSSEARTEWRRRRRSSDFATSALSKSV